MQNLIFCMTVLDNGLTALSDVISETRRDLKKIRQLSL